MPKKLQVTKQQEFICDECGKRELLDIAEKRTGWISAKVVENDGLRLFQRVSKERRYESFHIPNQEEKVYCSRDCILKNLTKSVDLFIAEVSIKTIQGLKRTSIETNTGEINTN
jgi:hypothetical protein